jgi:energy-coupling factor transporter ATP-binding protein EcfA2
MASSGVNTSSMLTSLDIHNLRGLRELSLPEAGRVNLIVGRNDSGKTSLLEAIRLLLTGDPRHLRRINRSRLERRPLDPEQDYHLAFYHRNTEAGLEVTGNIDGHVLRAQAKIVEVIGEETLPLEFDSDSDPSESIKSLLQPGSEIVVEIEAGNGARATIRQPLRGRVASVRRSHQRLISSAFPTIPPLVWLGTNRAEAWAHARRYSDLYRTGGAPLLLDILKEIEPRLNSLLILTDRAETGPSGAVLEVDIGLE